MKIEFEGKQIEKQLECKHEVGEVYSYNDSYYMVLKNIDDKFGFLNLVTGKVLSNSYSDMDTLDACNPLDKLVKYVFIVRSED